MAIAYQHRIVDDELDQLLTELPAIAIEGPRGVGKTATAQRRANTVHYLDDPAQWAIVSADPNIVLTGRPPVLIDEWQRVPAVWDAVRRAVDRGCQPGQFLLTGSASPTVSPSHTGAGRIVTLRMRPMSLAERGLCQPTIRLTDVLAGGAEIHGESPLALADYVRELVASGFPAIRRLGGRAHRLQLAGYVKRIIDTDFVEQGHRVRRPEVLERWLAAYAAATATSASFETIRDAATAGHGDKPARSTIIPYREILERLWILDPVPAWLPTRNWFTRLGQSPKHHLADPALAAGLLGVDGRGLLAGEEPATHVPRDGTLLGHLFESLVALGLRVAAQPADARVCHLNRSSTVREVDLIIERPDQGVVAVEVKLSATVTDGDVMNLRWLRDRLGDALVDAVVVNTGPRAYRRPDGIAVIPAALLG